MIVYEYDELNRLSEVKDPFGNTTTYTYDVVRNKLSISYSNGTITEYTYDKLYRLTKMETRKANGDIISSYEYTLGLAGNRLKVSENTGRVVENSYDDTYKLIEEKITMHKYFYANANPMTYYDPSGYFSISYVVIGIAISSILAGIVSGVFAYLRTGSLKEALWSGVKSVAFSAVMSIICLKFPAVVPYLLSFGIGTIAYQISTGEFDGMDAAEIAT
ncbi:RHS repeat domain-containing protein [Acetivibrio saccincola]|uniref:Deoxyribonuclease RhsC n=1 Tax=Acetivibrio saccincola TaxID=1677857 RepID=A0A2K9EGC2_9FIRM|nr:RHS repeat domain-containing protein [Acetivibrio saccincola]AUG58265.1 Putative deoxyribonuclease RhsC [Acetivibrio saccincola]